MVKYYIIIEFVKHNGAIQDKNSKRRRHLELTA